MNTIRFEIPIVPTGQRRARHTARGGFSRTYKDSKQIESEADIMVFLAQHKPEKPINGPVNCTISLYFPIPKSVSKKQRKEIDESGYRHSKKPDIDNCLKQLFDCMTRIGFWADDSQVSDCLAIKRYTQDPGIVGWWVNLTWEDRE